ncbi:hypothetical protein T459_20052 [Capsicum annuum]|uniref:Uncharacterized protein n=1 Tax=Capsicum annuum TaxID=4072 RepID=A0A2G2Z3D1_CAPAN|nr:hypothetical protein T459_20052 [Capsicum annuum]
MVRTPIIDKNGIKRGAWSEDEDNKLRAYVERFGHLNWRQYYLNMLVQRHELQSNNRFQISADRVRRLMRCGKSCRLRWMNYLRPGLKKGNCSPEEELILKLHKELGNNDCYKVTRKIGQRCQNHWDAHHKKRIRLTNANSSTSTEKFTESSSSDSKNEQSCNSDEAGYDMKEVPISSDLSNKLNGVTDWIEEEDNPTLLGQWKNFQVSIQWNNHFQILFAGQVILTIFRQTFDTNF